MLHAGRDLFLDLVTAHRFERVSFGQHRLGLGDLRGDGLGREFAEVDAYGGLIFRRFEHALHFAQVRGLQSREVVALREGLVVLVDHLHGDEAEVVRQFAHLHKGDRVDFEPFAVHALSGQFDGFGVTVRFVGGAAGDCITGDGAQGRDGRNQAVKILLHGILFKDKKIRSHCAGSGLFFPASAYFSPE